MSFANEYRSIPRIRTVLPLTLIWNREQYFSTASASRSNGKGSGKRKTFEEMI
jgi:hypothetical protein